MEKTTFFIFLLAFLLISCSDENNEYAPASEEDLKYVFQKLEKYGLKGDVKMVEKLYYPDAKWSDVLNNMEKGEPSSKTVYTFDRNGVLKRIVVYVGENLDQIFGETYFTYDHKYRLTEVVNTENSGFNVLLQKTVIVYDDLNKMATTIYSFGSSGNMTVERKYVQSLNEDGHLDDRYTEYYPVIITKAGAVKDFSESVLLTNRDQKGNSIFSYIRRKSGRSVAIDDCFEQFISYYDGAFSQKVISDQQLYGEPIYKAEKSLALELHGDVKKVITYSFIKPTWNSVENVLVESPVSGKMIQNFDESGVLISYESYLAPSGYEMVGDKYEPILYADIRPVYKYKCEYDSKFRITDFSEENYSYTTNQDNSPSAIKLTKTLIVYDDARKKARVLKYGCKDGIMSSEPFSEREYSLDGEGFAISTNYEEYWLKSMLKNESFSGGPEYTVTIINNKDKNDNWIESYKLLKYFDNNKLTNVGVSSLEKREIEYY